MLEVEMKFAVSDQSTFRERLIAAGAAFRETIEETDEYFNAPDRDFATTDEALRIRRTGANNRVTYKGPKIDSHTKTRTEIEVPLADGQEVAKAFAEVLVKLGYRASGVVRKRRTIYDLLRGDFSLEACLDEVQDLGSFVELEIQAQEDRLDAAREVLLETAAMFGLSTSERRSYLQMLLTR